MRRQRASAARPVGVTGGGSVLGAALLTRLGRASAPADPPPDPPRDPPRDLRELPTGARSLVSALAGLGTVVHLAPGRDPGASPAIRDREVAGTRALLSAARAAGVGRVVLVTSTDVYRARPGEVPLPETAPVGAAAGASLTGAWVEAERLADHARRTGVDVVVLRPAAVVGLEQDQTGPLLRSLRAVRLLAVRGVEPLWQLCHLDDLVTALELAADGGVRGPCAVASEGWLTQAEVERIAGRRRLELPAAVALSTAERLHRLGAVGGSPDELELLLAPVVVEPTALRAAGWRPGWTAERALRAHLDTLPDVGRSGSDRAAAYAAGTAGATAALVGTAALVRAARRRRRR